MAAAAILRNLKNRDITATDWQIFAKFGMTIKMDLLTAETVKKFEFPKSKMAERKQQPTTEGETEVLVYKIKCTSRSQIQTQEFYTPWNISGTAKATVFKFPLLVGRVKC